jgi:hypothetical protein
VHADGRRKGFIGVAFGLVWRPPRDRHPGPDGQRISQPVPGHCGDGLIGKALGRGEITASQGRLGMIRHVYRRGLVKVAQMRPVSRCTTGIFDDYQRLVHKQDQLIEHLIPLHLRAAGDGLGRVEVEPTHKHRQSAEQNAFGFGQQRM